MTGEDVLQVVARFERRGGIELEGSAEALLRFAGLLRGGESHATYPLSVPASHKAAPYDGFLARLRLATLPGPLLIQRDGLDLRIEGSAESLATLAHNVEFLVSSDIGSDGVEKPHEHIHVEYYEDHPYLSRRSEPLMIARDLGLP